MTDHAEAERVAANAVGRYTHRPGKAAEDVVAAPTRKDDR